MQAPIDFLAIGAHPDDIEIMAGGTIARLIHFGKKGVLLDMTAGEMGTRGSEEIRHQEAQRACRELGVQKRICLGLPDAHLQVLPTHLSALVNLIREVQPKVIITHNSNEDHPDHVATHELVKKAAFLAGLQKFEPQRPPFRPERLFFTQIYPSDQVSFCVDISDFWDKKSAALAAYESQFHNERADLYTGKTNISTPEFLSFIQSAARFYGLRIGRQYGEAYVCKEIPEISDITALGGRRF